MANKKVCYRVQVGSGLGLESKCISKRRAKKFQRLVDTGGMMSWVNKSKPRNKNDWVK